MVINHEPWQEKRKRKYLWLNSRIGDERCKKISREREIDRDIMKLNVVHKTIITYFFSADFCSSSYNQCFGGWWEDDRDLTGVIPVSEIERPSLANGELSQKILVEKELSEVECRVICWPLSILTLQEVVTTPSCCEMYTIHDTFIHQYCRKKSPSLIDILDKWFTR